MEKDCVKCEISSDNEESAISEEKVFLNEQVKVEPDDVHLKIKEETLGTEHVDRDYDSIPPDLKYERPVKQEASLSAFGGPQPTLQSSALQASQPRLPPIAAAAQNQIPKLLRTTTSPSRQGVFVQQFLQNPLSASSTTTVTGCVVNTVSLPQAVGAQSLPQMIGVPIVPQVVGAPSQPVVEATVTAAHATVPQNQFPTATQTATQPNCIQVLPTVTSGQQSVSNITPSVEDVQQCLQQAGVNAGIIVVMKPSGIPTIITSNEQLQLLLQQIQLQQAQPLQAQLQQAQLQQAQLQQAQLQQAQLQQAQLQQAQLQQVQLQQAQLQQAQLQQAQLQQAQLQQAQFQQAQVQLQPQVQFQQAQVQLQQAQVQLQHAQIKGQGQLQPQVEIRPGVQQVKLTLQPSQSVALNTEDIMRPLVQTGTVGSHNDLDVKPPLSVENTFPFDDQRNPTEEAQPMSSRTTLDVPKLVFCSQSPSPSKGRCPTPYPSDEVEITDSGESDHSSGESDASFEMPLDDEIEDESDTSSDNGESGGDNDKGDSDWISSDNMNNCDGSRPRRHHRHRGSAKKQVNGNTAIDWQRMDWLHHDPQNAPKKLPFNPPRKGFLPPDVLPKEEIDFFQLFFSDDLIEAIVNETNRYAAKKILVASPLTQFSQWKDWKTVTVDEMKAFLGFIMNMAMSHKPQLSDYFSLEWTVKQDFFPDVFSRHRFYQIFRALHVADLSTKSRKQSSRSYKIQDMWRYIDTASRKYFAPDEDLVLDVSIVGVKGRIEFKCRNLRKAISRELKIYVVKDCKTGFICAMEPYFRQSTAEDLIRPDLPFTARIVLHLMSRILEEQPAVGHHVFMDKFFSSVTLAKELLKMDTYVTGTITPNRKDLPVEVKEKYLKKIGSGEILSFTAEDVVVMAYGDKCPVVMLSTYHGNRTRRGADGREDAQKPNIISDFSAKMSAIGKADHLCPAYEFSIRSHVWWRKLFFWLLEISVMNSYCLFNLENRRQGLKPVNHVVFRKNLIRQLVGNIRNEPARKRRRESAHTIERLNNTFHSIGISKRSRDCAVCSDRSARGGGRKQTSFICSTCVGNPALHVPACFNKYHTEQKYR